jgi:hypothetical protein
MTFTTYKKNSMSLHCKYYKKGNFHNLIFKFLNNNNNNK